MKICVLASGSKCNSSYLETENNKILIDFGTTLKYTKEKLEDIDVNLEEIDSVFITHSHHDHIYGLTSYIKKYNGKIFLTEKIYKELNLDLPNYQIIDNSFKLNELEIDFIKLSHDVSEILGYIFRENNKTISYITDTGYINKKYFEKLKNHNCYIIESNHDVEMVMNSNYNYYTKMRIIGDKGHLSNEKTSEILSLLIGTKTKEIVLIHLSEENNNPALAKKTVENRLNNNSKIYVSTQKERTELIEI